MTVEKFSKALIAGLAFPACLLPFVYTFLYFVTGKPVQELPLQFIPLYLPIIFGFTNVIYIWIGERFPITSINLRLWVTGASLGLIIAIIGVFVIHISTLVFGFTHGFQYLPIILIPIIYGAIFRYIIKWLNYLLEISSDSHFTTNRYP